MKRLGIMGGTFNPIHYGHLISAEIVKEQLGLDNILFIPTGNPPHKNKSEVLEACHRVDMLKLAIEGNESFSISEIEVERKGKTYTYDTLVELHEQYSDCKFYFIIGFDTLKELRTWRKIEEVGNQCCFAVVNRSNTTEEMESEVQKTTDQFQLEIILIDMPNIEISSTELRNRIFQGKSIRYMMPETVADYIDKNMLYR